MEPNVICIWMQTLRIIFVSVCYKHVSSVSLLNQEPTQAHPPQKTETAQASSPSNPEKEPKKPSNSPSPSLALLRLLQTAFNRQTPALQQPHAIDRASTTWGKQQPDRSLSPPATRLPPQMLYQALDLINKYQSPEDSVYSDYRDGFYSTKPYRHRDDRLLQALFKMLDADRKWRPGGGERRGETERCKIKGKVWLCVGWGAEEQGKEKRESRRIGSGAGGLKATRRNKGKETLPLSFVFPKNAAYLIFLP